MPEPLTRPQEAAISVSSWSQAPLMAWVWSSALGRIWMVVGDEWLGFRQVAGS